MSYEGWEYGYTTGFVGAMAYCLVNPARGLMIAAAIASVTSNPGRLSGAGDKWDQIAKEIGTIGADLKKHVGDLPAESWTAEDELAFKDAVKLVVANVGEGQNAHEDTAKIMHGLGRLSFYGAMTSAAVGVFLTALTIYTVATRGIPGVNAATQLSSELAATSAQVTTKSLVMKYGAVAGAAALAFGLLQAEQGELEAQVAMLGGQGKALGAVPLPLTNI